MKRIDLRRQAQAWFAWHYENNKPDPAMIALFGTHGLPTSFTPYATATVVRAEIQRLNPQHEIRLVG